MPSSSRGLGRLRAAGQVPVLLAIYWPTTTASGQVDPIPTTVASFDSGFTKPTNAPAFATFMVSFASQKQGFDVNPFDFFVRTPEGARVQPTFGCEPAFNAATLGAGEKFQGCLTVDVAHGNLVNPVNMSTEEYCALTNLTVTVRPGDDDYEELDAWLRLRGK
ncbi:hypothetical protein [Frankia gtarii]|uniref:hypothetical protein n=1 Tax=Frankia gtarii TaxID=2950102 RepID=UPI0021BE9B10|nr:hypothetical protein [Frankia gtarii]